MRLPFPCPSASTAAVLASALLFLGLASPGPVRAQDTQEHVTAPPSGARPMAVAHAGVRTGDIDIDGHIDEAAWQAAPLITGFVTSEPVEGAKPTRKTEVRILFDDDALYVAARMYDDPDSIQKQLVRRDERGPYFDWFGFSIDPNRDQRTGYQFRVNAAGVQQDMYVSDDNHEDTNWNAVWASAVAYDSLGWTMEARLPLSQIRYDSKEGPQTWGLNLHRRRVAAGELSHFSLESRKINGLVSQYGLLEDVRVPSTVRRIEARPYVLSSFHNGPAADGDPFFTGRETGGRVGTDLRLGLGSAFTLDGTVNPDFGQVDADPAVINLTAFESFFQERRPFFVEDAQVFDFGLSGGRNSLFYSRRIGRSPHGGAPSGADFVDIPDAATILGAAKVTGRTASGLSVGALTAVTKAETGRAFFSDSGTTDRFAVEPRTEYGVVSAKQDLNGGMTQVGVLLTGLRRTLPADGSLGYLPDQAYSGGVRFDHQWDQRQWKLNGFLATSRVQGTPEAMLAVQTSSVHYFQRPDASRVRVDSAATSMSGAEWRIQLDRQNTEHWTGAVWSAGVTPGFEVNDIGFSTNRERIDGGMNLGYRTLEPGTHLRDYSVGFNTVYNFSWEAIDHPGSWDSWRTAYTNGHFSLNGNVTLLNYNTLFLNVNFQPDLYSRTATRGGPVMIEPGDVNSHFSFGTDRKKPTSLRFDADYTNYAHGSGHGFAMGANVSIRPNPRLQLSVNPNFYAQRSGSQYVTSTDAVPYAATYGRRYLFGEIERRTLGLELRTNYTFSPTLSLQLYAQPLLSSGDYVRYKQLLAPDSYAFRTFQRGEARSTAGGGTVCRSGDICLDAAGTQHVDFDGDGVPDFTFSDRDFNVRSLVGNAVLRWEYRPGSTVFLVWQRQQDERVNEGDFSFGRDLSALARIPAQNRFILKIDYWLGL